MNDKAYAVLLVKDGRPGTIIGAGVFGEPHPTTMGSVHTIPLFDQAAESFEVAARLVEEHLASPFYDWCGELKTDPHRGRYRDARTVRNG